MQIMDPFKFLLFGLIYEIKAIIAAKEFKILKGQKALLNAMSIARAHSATECALKCNKRDDCNHANFGNSQCEFLKYETPGTEIVFEDESEIEFIYKSHL